LRIGVKISYFAAGAVGHLIKLYPDGNTSTSELNPIVEIKTGDST